MGDLRGRLALLIVPAVVLWASSVGASSPRIVEGTTTAGHGAVGVLLQEDTDEPGHLYGVCSGTLIGCHTFITAAHCVCPDDTEDAEGCLEAGTTDPLVLRVFLPYAGILPVEAVAIHPRYSFATRGDAAIVRLATSAEGVAPMPINDRGRPPAGTVGRIVGYGSTGGPPFRPSDFGVKREGPVTTRSCIDDIPNDAHTCWRYDGTGANSCLGDSGGPLLVDLDGVVLAGLTSGGESFDCLPPDQVFATDIFVLRDLITAELANDTLASCGDLPAVGEEGAVLSADVARLTEAKPELALEITVPPGARLLRVALNGEENGGEGFFRVANAFDLAVGPEGGAVACEETSAGVFGACDISAPAPGPWVARALLREGEGTVQLTASVFSSLLVGDANCDEHLGAADLVAVADLYAREAPPPCDDADATGDGVIDGEDVAPTIAALFGD